MKFANQTLNKLINNISITVDKAHDRLSDVRIDHYYINSQNEFTIIAEIDEFIQLTDYKILVDNSCVTIDLIELKITHYLSFNLDQPLNQLYFSIKDFEIELISDENEINGLSKDLLYQSLAEDLSSDKVELLKNVKFNIDISTNNYSTSIADDL